MRALTIATSLLLGCVLATAPAVADRPRWQTLPLPLPAMPASSTSGTVTVGTATLWYGTYGDPDGAPVILLHGGLGNSDHWVHQVPALAKFHVIAIDSRGQGRSTLGTGPLSYRGMATDVVAVMDALGVARASLVGWSDGGAVALALAIRHPERVGKLVVFGTNYDARGSKRNRQPETFAAYSAQCKGDHARLANPHPYATVTRALAPVWKTQGGFTKAELRKIAAPMLIVDGAHDEIVVLAQLEEMAKLVANARLVVLADTSHFAHWQDPAAFNRAVVEFLGAK